MAIKSLTLDEQLPTLSACMIIKNGEEGLKKLLPEIKNSVDEIIVVDTGSTDNSKQVALDNGAKVYDFEWCNDFAKARNISLQKSTSQYNIFLDDDDIIKRIDIFIIKEHLKKMPNTAVYIRLKDHINEVEFTESMQLRVFPNDKRLFFKGAIHEQITQSIEEAGIKYSHCNATVEHFGYKSPEEVFEKLKRNFNALQEQIKENPDDFISLLFLGRTALALNQFITAKISIENAIKLIKEGKTKVSNEHILVCFVTQAILLDMEEKTVEAYRVLESIKTQFKDNLSFKLTLGEVLFKLKKYDKAYKELINFRSEKIPIGSYPVSLSKIIPNIRTMLLSSSLYMGDFKTAELCIQRILHDPEYKIKNRK